VPIEINSKNVAQVLLSDGNWHEVVDGSFHVGDAWPWQQSGDTTAAHWTEAGDTAERTVFCPLSAIRAVAYGWDDSSQD
jgi:hypothetical protein